MTAEVIVVGAGPAGASAAYHLASLGRQVLLLDRARFPRDKSCGDGLTLPAVRLLDSMGVLDRLNGPPRIAGARVFMRGRGQREFLYPTGKVSPDFGLVVPRYRLDHAICSRAVEAGAELWEKTLATRLIREQSRVVGVEVTRQHAVMRLFAPVVVAADGAASRLSAQAGLAESASEHFGFAIRGYYTNIERLDPLLEIYMPLMDPTDRYVLPSYGWVFPTGDGNANIGVGIFERGYGTTVRQLMDAFLRQLRETDSRFDRMGAAGRWLGAPLSFEFQPDRCFAPGFVRVGDAAGMISPFTGEGISYALESGKVAAEAIHRNLGSSGETPDLSDYACMMEKRFLGYFEAGRRSARRYRLLWHVLESTFHNEKPLFAMCRKVALFPEAIGHVHASEMLDDVGPLIDRGGLRVREDLLAVGEVLLGAMRKEWPFLARMSATGTGDPSVPFRPALLLLLAAALGDSRDPRLISAASAIELGYLAALAHLSVDDEHRAFEADSNGDRPANWGNMLALLSGDFLLSKGYEFSAGVGVDVSLEIAESLAIVCEGRVREQSAATNGSVSEEEYERIATLEIATLFELPCHLGAKLGGLPTADIEAMRSYGRNLGLAFHYADQVLDLCGEASELGKASSLGFRSGGLTAPVRVALQRDCGESLRRILTKHALDDNAASLARRMIEECGAVQEIMARAEAFAVRARQAIAAFKGPAHRTLTRLAGYAVERKIDGLADLRRLL